MDAPRNIALVVAIWVTLTALTASAEVWAPMPSPAPGTDKDAAIGGMASLGTVFLGFFAAAMSFLTLKELI